MWRRILQLIPQRNTSLRNYQEYFVVFLYKLWQIKQTQFLEKKSLLRLTWEIIIGKYECLNGFNQDMFLHSILKAINLVYITILAKISNQKEEPSQQYLYKV